ncbi:hypothetical protein ACHAXT_002986 [Thalassiosira profunda]
MAPHHTTHFETRKFNCLAKRDKSSAGRIDPRAVDVCAALNARDEYYTTSSCAGRCLLYVGDGIKSWHTVDGDGAGVAEGGDGASAKHGFFRRFRVSHDLVQEPRRYLNLTTLFDGQDPTGGGDPIPTVGQFDHGNNAAFRERLEENNASVPAAPVWLRFEPFILHVMCRSLKAASVLMALARPSFKNVGLTSWNTGRDEGGDDVAVEEGGTSNQQCKGGGPRYLVAVWGDEGLDMPLSLPSSPERGVFYDPESGIDNAAWVAQLVNERHERNWAKIERFVEAVKGLEEGPVDVDCSGAMAGVVHGMDGVDLSADNTSNGTKSDRALSGLPIPRSYDVVGDVAILNSLPEGGEETQKEVGEWIMSRNKAIKICVARTNPLSTQHRSPGETGLIQLAGPPRDPIVTSHYEYGVKCVVDLQQTFFSPRMAPERMRLCQSVARGERVLVVFAGVGMEALQIVSRTEAREVLTIERNAVAVECLRRAQRMLERNKTVKCPDGGKGAAERLSVREGDALEILPTLETSSFDRIIAPRPKEGTRDGDLGTGDAGKQFLLAMLPLLKKKGEVHWYDFAADHELPSCERTRQTIQSACQALGLDMEAIHVAKVGSVAKRQFRVCVDFRITETSGDAP